MKWLALTLSIALPALLSSGCTRYVPIAAHTVAVGPDRQADIVWLIDEKGDDRVLRCMLGANGPVCTPMTESPAAKSGD